jgi:hypothetical protein
VNNRILCELLQQILPTGQTLVMAAAAEEKLTCLTVKITSRVEYNVFHEIIQTYIVPHSMTGYDRLSGFYLLPLSNLAKLQSELQQNIEQYKIAAAELFSRFVKREWNSLTY